MGNELLFGNNCRAFFFINFFLFASDPNGRPEVLSAVEQPSAQPGERHDGPAEQRNVRGCDHRRRGAEDSGAQSRVVRVQ